MTKSFLILMLGMSIACASSMAQTIRSNNGDMGKPPEEYPVQAERINPETGQTIQPTSENSGEGVTVNPGTRPAKKKVVRYEPEPNTDNLNKKRLKYDEERVNN